MKQQILKINTINNVAILHAKTRVKLLSWPTNNALRVLLKPIKKQ